MSGRPLTDEKFEDACGDHRHRRVATRAPADGAAAVADHRGVRGRDRRRGVDVRRHRRPVHLSRDWTSRAWAKAASPRWRARSGFVRRGSTAAWTPSVPAARVIAAMMAIATGHGPPRAVLPHAVGGDVPAADEGGQDVPAGGRPHLQLADAVRRHVGRPHPGAQRAAPLRPLRHHAGDARLDRAEPARQRRAEPDGHLPRPDDDGRLSERPDDHHAVRVVRLRRAVRRRDRGDRLGRRRRQGHAQAAGAVRGRRHPDHRAHRLGPDHA